MAAADLAIFRAAFPEFVRVEDDHVQKFLDLAEVSTPEDPWGVHQEEGHLYLTAHLLSQSPYGMNARLESDGKSANTTYGERYDRLKTMVACGLRVA